MDADWLQLDGPLSRASRADHRQIAEITADAFRTDPVNHWMFESFDAMAGVFGILARDVYVPRGLSYRLGDRGAAMWMLPGGSSEPPWLSYLQLLYTIVANGSRGAYRRTMGMVAAMEAAHPRFPHAYLFTIGVRPAHQGKGVGRQLIAPVLARCDELGLPAYLENSKPENHSFYRSCGFETAGWISPQSGAPPLEAMLRQPRAPL